MVQKIIIDVQDFKIANNKFVPKEVVILFNSSEYNSFLIKPPFSYRVSINDCGIQVGFDCVPTLSPEIE
jgi:hypothetical protein